MWVSDDCRRGEEHQAENEEFLHAEELYEKTEGASEFPKLVFDAMAMAREEAASSTVDQAATQSATLSADEPPAETAAESAEMPEPEAVAEIGGADETPLNEGDLDIKEIMARLEIAAERAQLRADDDARRDQGALEPEVLDRAVGGRA